MINVMCFIYGFYDDSACAAVEHQRHFPGQRILSKDIFSCVHQTMCEIYLLPRVSGQSSWEVVSYMNMQEMVQGSPQLSTCRTACHFSMSHLQVWQTACDED
jgi:hypothetical protein